VPKGATKANDAQYFNLSVPSPGKLVAPATPGEYELWVVKGDTLDSVMVRRPITVT
jgi:hypothetical protein